VAVRGRIASFFCGSVSVELLMQGQAVPAPPLLSPDRRLLRRGKGAPVAHHGAAARAASACSFTIQLFTSDAHASCRRGCHAAAGSAARLDDLQLPPASGSAHLTRSGGGGCEETRTHG